MTNPVAIKKTMDSYDKDIEIKLDKALPRDETADTLAPSIGAGAPRDFDYSKTKSFNLLDSDDEETSPTLKQFRSHRSDIGNTKTDMSKFLSGFK